MGNRELNRGEESQITRGSGRMRLLMIDDVWQVEESGK